MEITGTSPGRSSSSDYDAVCRGFIRVAEKSRNTINDAPIPDKDTVIGTVLTDNQVSTISPYRTCARDHHSVVRGCILPANLTFLIRNTSPITDHKTVAGTINADVEICRICPSRVRSGNQYAVVGRVDVVAD